MHPLFELMYFFLLKFLLFSNKISQESLGFCLAQYSNNAKNVVDALRMQCLQAQYGHFNHRHTW
jgi:hypothetical protein